MGSNPKLCSSFSTLFKAQKIFSIWFPVFTRIYLYVYAKKLKSFFEPLSAQCTPMSEWKWQSWFCYFHSPMDNHVIGNSPRPMLLKLVASKKNISKSLQRFVLICFLPKWLFCSTNCLEKKSLTWVRFELMTPRLPDARPNLLS